MKVYKPINLYLPQLLVDELHKYLGKYPPNFKFQSVYFYYVIHYLTVMQIQNKKDEFFALNKEYLKSVTVSNIARYVKILCNGKFIFSDNSYQVGVKALKYKINSKFIKDIQPLELKQDCKLSEKILNHHRKSKAHYNRLEPHLKAMCDEFMKVELDHQGAIEWVQTNASDNRKLSYLTSLNSIIDKRFRYFKRNKTNKRLDTNFTNLKSDLKQFIIGDYVSIDLKNSQPFLLSILIHTIISSNYTLCCYLRKDNLIKAFGIKGLNQILLIHQNQEKAKMVNFRSYFESVLNGVLYDEFIQSFDNNINRNDAKDIMFKVLFSSNEYNCGFKKKVPYEKDKKVFASVYPFVYDVVKVLKKKDHKALPIYLQQIESYLFIDCIAKELVNNGIVPFTIHDSVIVKVEHQAKTIEIMNEVFLSQLGVIPSFDIKKLKD